MKYRVTVAGRSFEIEIEHDRLVRVDGRPLYVDLEQVGGLPVYSLVLDDGGYVVFVEEGHQESLPATPYRVEIQGQVYPVEVQLQQHRLAPRRAEGPAPPEEGVIRAPLAGVLASLPVSVGEQVEAGQVVAVVESMKMKMELKAPCSGVVATVHGPPGRDVSQGEELAIIRADGPF